MRLCQKVALLALPTVVNGNDFVFEKCLSKQDSFGFQSDSATPFDHSQFLSENVARPLRLQEYNVCETSLLRLTSIALVQSDQQKSVRVYMPRIGPRLTNCSDVDLNHWGPIKYVRIFREDGRVSGIGVRFQD